MINKTNKIQNIFIVLIILILIPIIVGCIENEIQGTGKIIYNDFEGGFYGIISDDGEKYDPINLPDEYKENEINVRFRLNILDNQTSTHMWGTIVEIIEIEKL